MIVFLFCVRSVFTRYLMGLSDYHCQSFDLKTIESVFTASHIHEPKVHHKQSWLENILDFATGVYTARVPGSGKTTKERRSERSQHFMDFSLSN